MQSIKTFSSSVIFALAAVASLSLGTTGADAATQYHIPVPLGGDEVGAYLYPCGLELFKTSAPVPSARGSAGYIRATIRANGTYPSGTTSSTVTAWMSSTSEATLPSLAPSDLYCSPGSVNCTLDDVCGYGDASVRSIALSASSTGVSSRARSIGVKVEAISAPSRVIPPNSATGVTLARSERGRFDFWTVQAPSGTPFVARVTALNVTVVKDSYNCTVHCSD